MGERETGKEDRGEKEVVECSLVTQSMGSDI